MRKIGPRQREAGTLESNMNLVCVFGHDTYPPGLSSLLCKIQVYPEVTAW